MSPPGPIPRGVGVGHARKPRPSAPQRVEVRGLGKSFGAVTAARGVDLTVQEGETLALLGPSGCGKTTVLRLIAGLEVPDAGSVIIGGAVVADAATGLFVPPERRRVGMVFQDYALFPHLSVGGNVAYGLRGNPHREALVAEAARLVALDDVLERQPYQLSGGQQQRVALARALAPGPGVLLLDEPFSNLDARRRATMRDEVRVILKAAGTTSVFVTHDQEEALFMGDRVAVMHDGQVAQVGTPEEVFHRPADRFVALFLGDTSFLAGRALEGGVVTALGVQRQRLVVPAGTALEVLVRPDDVKLTPDPEGTGRVTRRDFRGMHQRYRVELATGEAIHCMTDHSVVLAPGAPVRVSICASHPLACFHGDVNVVDGQAPR